MFASLNNRRTYHLDQEKTDFSPDISSRAYLLTDSLPKKTRSEPLRASVGSQLKKLTEALKQQKKAKRLRAVPYAPLYITYQEYQEYQRRHASSTYMMDFNAFNARRRQERTSSGTQATHTD